jgi:drug/metabolite transporter (DMT)-like permease
MLGWVFMGEVPSTVQGLGAAAIIAANALLLRKKMYKTVRINGLTNSRKY